MKPLAATATLLITLTMGQAVHASTLQTERVEPTPTVVEYLVDGVVEARRQATLSAEVSGRIELVNFDVDDQVDAGETILRIRDVEYRSQLNNARAALDEARVGLQDAEREYDRVEDLRQKKLVAQSEFDKAGVALNAAKARVNAATAGVESATELLGKTVVKAPYSGVVVARHVEPGESVNPGQPIMTGYAEGEVRVVSQVPQSLIGGLRQRQAATIQLLDDSDRLAVDDITIHPFADPASHAFRVRFDIESRQQGLYPGMLVKVALNMGEVDRLTVPRSAIVNRSEVNAVYVVSDGGRVNLRQVRLGNPSGERVEILAGLSAGENIALDPVRAAIALKNASE